MAEDRLPWRRSVSMLATISERVISRLPAISFRPFQNASSRLTLVLCPAMTIERLTTGDFIGRLLFFPSGACRDRGSLLPDAQRQALAHSLACRGPHDWRRPADRPAAAWLACAPFDD